MKLAVHAESWSDIIPEVVIGLHINMCSSEPEEAVDLDLFRMPKFETSVKSLLCGRWTCSILSLASATGMSPRVLTWQFWELRRGIEIFMLPLFLDFIEDLVALTASLLALLERLRVIGLTLGLIFLKFKIIYMSEKLTGFFFIIILSFSGGQAFLASKFCSANVTFLTGLEATATVGSFPKLILMMQDFLAIGDVWDWV